MPDSSKEGRKRKIFSKNGIRAVSSVIVAVIVIVAIVVVGVGVYVATRHSSTTSTATTATPTPKTSSTSSPKATSTAESTPTSSTNDIATASSYEFNLTEYAANGTLVDTGFYAADNLGTSNVQLLWVAQTPSQGTFEYIVNGETQQAWAVTNGQVTNLSAGFSSEVSIVEADAGLYVNMLKGWGGSGSFTYTVPTGQPNAGYKAEFTNIHLNISLPATYFQAPS